MGSLHQGPYIAALGTENHADQPLGPEQQAAADVKGDHMIAHYDNHELNEFSNFHVIKALGGAQFPPQQLQVNRF